MNSPLVNRPGLQKGSWSSDKQKGPGHQTRSLNIASDLCLQTLDLFYTVRFKRSWSADQVYKRALGIRPGQKTPQ